MSAIRRPPASTSAWQWMLTSPGMTSLPAASMRRSTGPVKDRPAKVTWSFSKTRAPLRRSRWPPSAYATMSPPWIRVFMGFSLFLAFGREPRAREALDERDRPEEEDGHDGEEDHGAERQLGLPVRGRREDHVAEPLVGADELADDGADHGQRDGHLGAGEEERQRHRQPDFQERLERAGPVRAAQVEELGRRRRQPGRGVDDDREEGDEEGHDHLGD